jgi:hypothetical protein
MAFSQGHALTIGVGSYAHAPGRNVPGTAVDAHAVASTVQNPAFCGYPASQITLLCDADASRDHILAGLAALTETSPDDTVLLFYSGHGEFASDGSYVLSTHDTQWHGERVRSGSGIGHIELLKYLQAIPAQRVLLVFNACHAGLLSPTLGNQPPRPGHPLPSQTAQALLATGSGRIIISACRENQYSFVGLGEQTLFGQALAEGLRGGGEVFNRNGYISAFDLYTHLYYALEDAVPRDVPQHIRDRYGSRQEPELTVLKGVGPFAVALYRGATSADPFPADHALPDDVTIRELSESRSRRALESILGTAIVQGDNTGQNVGVNTGTMHLSRQEIYNIAPNQGAQGTFEGPVTFHQPQSVAGNYIAGNQIINQAASPIAGTAPRKPSLIIGRDDDLRALKQRVGIATPGSAPAPMKVLTAMRGWPGVGKTTLAAALAHDAEISERFPDGVLWASLGQQPSLFGALAAWGRALGVPDLNQARTIEEASQLLRGLLRSRRYLLIVDDAWKAEHVLPFHIGGSGCAVLITTRLPEVARQIAPTPGDVSTLGVLSEADALELLRTLAPTVVAGNEATSRELVNDLEGLPLAIQVAGRLLQTEASYGFGVTQLLADIREGAKLIEAQAPADRAEVAQETTPTVAALLKKSTDLLDVQTLDCFAYLGAFAPKPATFDATAMQTVWEVDDPRPAIRTLVDRGLLEPSGQERFWMHAILVAHAKSFLTEE